MTDEESLRHFAGRQYVPDPNPDDSVVGLANDRYFKPGGCGFRRYLIRELMSRNRADEYPTFAEALYRAADTTRDAHFRDKGGGARFVQDVRSRVRLVFVLLTVPSDTLIT